MYMTQKVIDPGIHNITASGAGSSWTSPRSLPPWLPV